MAGYQPKYPVNDPAVQGNFEDLYARLNRRDDLMPSAVCVAGYTQAGSNAAAIYLVGSAGVGLQIPLVCSLREVVVACAHIPSSAKTVSLFNVDSGVTRTFPVTGVFTRYRPDPAFRMNKEEGFSLSISRQTTNTGYSVQCMFREYEYTSADAE